MPQSTTPSTQPQPGDNPATPSQPYPQENEPMQDPPVQPEHDLVVDAEEIER